MYPSQIKKELETLHDQYLEGIASLARDVMDSKLKPYLNDKGLSLTCMNGCLQCYDSEGNLQDLPKVVENLLEICAPCGHRFIYELPDYNPFKHNFSDLDTKAFKERTKDLTTEQSILSCWQTIHGI